MVFRATSLLENIYDIFFPLSPESTRVLCLPLSHLLEILPRASAPSFTVKKFPIFVCFSYTHPDTRALVYALKFEGSRKAAKRCAELMLKHLFEELNELELFCGFKNPLVIPIPLSPKREAERGFNQARRLAEHLLALSPKLGELECKALIRVKNTAQQARIQNTKKRAKNVRGAFQVSNPQKIAGRYVLLIDDVLTTGATAGECVRTLKKAGAREVYVVAFAH